MFTPQSFQTRSFVTVSLGNLFLALTYYGMAEVARAIASTPGDVTPVWPPDGIAMAIVLLFGHQFLPGVFVGSFLSNIWAFWPANASSLGELGAIGAVVGIALGTTLGTALAITTWQRITALPSPNPFLNLGPTVKFLIYVGLCGPGINATIGALMLTQLQVIAWIDYGSVWFTWWISNVAGVWIVSPFIICWYYWFQRSWRNHQRQTVKKLGRGTPLRWSRQRALEVGVLAGLVIVIGHGAFWSDRPFAYMLMPLLIWATFRFGPVGCTSVTAITAAISIGGTVNGKGSFAHTAHTCDVTDILCQTNANLQHLQVFIVVMAFTALILVSILEERKTDARKLTTLIEELETTNQYLEERVSLRTEEIREKNQQLSEALQTLSNTQSKVIQTEKMIGLGQIVAGIAHEFNNPLSVISGNLKYLEGHTQDLIKIIHLYNQTYPSAPAIQQYLDAVDLPFLSQDLPNILRSMDTGTTRMENIVASLRRFSRLDEAHAKVVDVHEGIESALHLLQHRCQDSMGNRITITKEYGNLPLVECYPGELNQVFLYLLTNAIDAFDAMAGKGDRQCQPTDLQLAPHPYPLSAPAHIHIQTALDDEGWIIISIADNGPGIPMEIQSRMFEPFFSTKPIGQGTGMGLAISYQIITETHAGDLSCTSNMDRGTEFIIRIPCQIEGSSSPKNKFP